MLALGYGFDGIPFRPCDEVYKSETFKPWGATLATDGKPGAARRPPSRELWLPFPKSYIRGLDQQKADFEEPCNAFLAGQWKKGGWWYYYLYGLGIKTPVGTIGLALCALLTLTLPRRFSRGVSPQWREEVVLLSLVLGVLFLVSSQYNMSCHVRYAVPLLGAFFVLVSRVVPVLGSASHCGTLVIAGCTAWSVCSSLCQYPHCLGYFNEVVGGSEGGHRFLNHSNVDWGQDLYYLRTWYDRHPGQRPFFLSADSLYNPESIGIRYSKPYRFVANQNTHMTQERSRGTGPKPGWYAISKNNLQLPDADYTYLLSCEQVATVGSTIRMYHVSLRDANRIRMSHSLPLLSADWELRTANARAMETVVVKELTVSADSCRARPRPFRVAVLHFQYTPQGDDTLEQDICRAVQGGLKCSCGVITVEAVSANVLRSVDVLLVPGGSSELMARDLGREGRDAIRHFLQHGGGYIGICAGAFLATHRYENCLGVVEATLLEGTCEVPGVEVISMAERGEGQVAVRFTDSGKMMFGGSQEVVSASYSGGPVFQDDVLDKVPSYVTLARYVSEVTRCERQKGTMIQTPAIVAGRFGRGCFILFGFHPEATATTNGVLLRAIEGVCRRQGAE